MLKNIIIPEKVGNYFIYPQRILGFDINKNYVSAIQIRVSGQGNAVIEKYLEEPLTLKENETQYKSTGLAIKNILSRADNYDYIKILLPSYLVIFKELILPFVDDAKIKSILNFEIEPILPFSVNDAVLDFIVTKKDYKKKETTIFVTIARKKDVQELLDPFRELSVRPNFVIVDTIALFELYKIISPNADEQEGKILIDIEQDYTNISYLQDGKLKLVRSIQQGISHIIKKLADALNINSSQARSYLYDYGFENNSDQKYKIAIEEIMNGFISNIAFTLNSFRTLLPFFSEIKKLISVGRGTQIKNLENYLSKNLNISTSESITLDRILQNKLFNTKESLPNSAIVNLSIAYPYHNLENFNLLTKELTTFDNTLLKKQVFTFTVLMLSILTILITQSYIQTKKIRREVVSSRNEVISSLKNTFSINDPAILKNLSEVVNEANKKVTEEENIWFAFSSQARFSFLKYLQELSAIIDREAIGLELKRLSIAEGIITLEGEVRDYKSLEILEKELNQSKLFSHVTIPQETKFSIKLTIRKNEENI